MVLLYNMLCEDFSITAFSPKHDIFITKDTSSEMLSFLHRWDYCWKYENDTDVKIEWNIIINMIENNHVFIKSAYQNVGFYKKSVYQNVEQEVLLQEMENSNLFYKNCA